MPDDTAVSIPSLPVAYYYKDPNLGEDKTFPVYNTTAMGGRPSWWLDEGVKLRNLLSRFKMHDTVKQACYIAGISEEQYQSFKQHHAWVIPVIKTYKTLPAARLKDIILEAAVGGKETVCGMCKGSGSWRAKECFLCHGSGKVISEPSAKLALGAYRIFEETETDPDFAPPSPLLAQLPIGGSVATLVQTAYLDSEGKVLVTKDSVEVIKNHGD